MRYMHQTLIGIVDAIHILAPIGRFHRRRVSVLQEQVAGLLKRNARLQDKVRSQADDIVRLNGYVATLEEEILSLESEATADEPIPYKLVESSPELSEAESPASAYRAAPAQLASCREPDIHYPWRHCARELPCPYHLPSDKISAAAKSIGARNVDANGAPVEEQARAWTKDLVPLIAMGAMLLPALGLAFTEPARATGAADAESPIR